MRISMQASALVALAAHMTEGISLNVSDRASIIHAASTIAYGLMSYYTGNITDTETTVGVLPSPYYWWEAGAMWGAMLDYEHYTNDSSYHNVTTQALLSQVGPLYDYMVPWHQKDEGNDDQSFWGFATMSAAEKDYPQPTIGNYSWVQLTENLWNTQVRRWDTSTCNGGLRWQIFSFNNGYDYKNSVSNGAFFQLSARLARFTGNQTYIEWANKAYDWMSNVGFIDPNYHIFDGASNLQNCSTKDQIIWTYNAGIALYGAAVLYNYTNGSALWTERTEGLLNATSNFFSPFDNSSNIMYEPACETVNTCDNDQFSFKGYLSRFMWDTTILAPFTKNAITALLTPSAQAAAKACSGGASNTCGQKWYVGGFDGKVGVGQQMSAMETIQGLLIDSSVPPLHSDQVHLMAAATTSSAPILVQTSAPTKSAATSDSVGFLSWSRGLAAVVLLVNMCLRL
ncbi:glycoside hydrolase family 76 protein [Hyaloscypha variabilis F]|uniref:Mannan endo-1,6-alpha-mannosidase n=1 Tax=Hyaloscypha variabilis (strain UAMH 11265 / GT02V1 / F) TaxID=1149755 RepID=A0A2J6S931_HYAVF|nr:glycoside hydrolase family 76 protein [Hyaloscypha variabilis F]